SKLPTILPLVMVASLAIPVLSSPAAATTPTKPVTAQAAAVQPAKAEPVGAKAEMKRTAPARAEAAQAATAPAGVKMTKRHGKKATRRAKTKTNSK
ncbi:MAG: hypothetical protein HY692_02050, partial [Cyanobacteria bacterium NC_groundwater_1444_Ag_S-0.65um_54_12]|nr:hypothetical protein [Cyanobacteria bacterium NC_groundwater_1444_Ag_S-0.65um_54_12]